MWQYITDIGAEVAHSEGSQMATISNTLARCRLHLGKGDMESSARLCLAQAIKAHDDGDFTAAWRWAAKCLKYSVGVFHKDFQAADLAAKLCANR